MNTLLCPSVSGVRPAQSALGHAEADEASFFSPDGVSPQTGSPLESSVPAWESAAWSHPPPYPTWAHAHSLTDASSAVRTHACRLSDWE